MIADILGVQKTTIKNVVNLNERLKATKPPRKKGPTGVAREVLQLYGNASLASLPIQASEGFKSRRDGETTRWVWCEFSNSAHPAKIHLHHWHRLSDTKKKDEDEDIQMNENDQKPCCKFRAVSDYGPASFNKKAQVVRYSPSFYAKHVAPSSVGWSSWETDYLFDLCDEFDLRFTVIYDRYAPLTLLRQALSKAKGVQTDTKVKHVSKSRKKSDSIVLGSFSATAALSLMPADRIKSLVEQIEPYQPRPLESLKDRYYSIARSLVEHEFRKKIQSVEARFNEMSQTIGNQTNIDALAHQKAQLVAETKEELNRHPYIKFHYE
ncbi:uncharacterized protein LOC129618099 [Condylostylus longicornis]|uniref:uncharacterized protein LOC129618099 n=1 Tax=Condylostylus longicornis TaxID=2530218 RepID=UPI00244E12BB|nr:uncharacterized protein LOC129618099 [Condylostylus longicornis]